MGGRVPCAMCHGSGARVREIERYGEFSFVQTKLTQAWPARSCQKKSRLLVQSLLRRSTAQFLGLQLEVVIHRHWRMV